MPSSSNHSLKCPECYKTGTICFRTLWTSLNHCCKDLKQKIAIDQKLQNQFLIQLNEIQMHLIYEQKFLKKTQKKPKKKLNV